MGRKKKHSLPFDKRGRVVAIGLHVLNSDAYLSLSAQAKSLMLLMHIHWRNEKPVDYGVREAQEKIPCGRKKAIQVFHELQERGFIVMVDESLFNSRTQGKTRSWRLTWLPYMDKFPTNEWEKASKKINSTGRLLTPLTTSQVSKVTPLKQYQGPQVSKVTPLG